MFECIKFIFKIITDFLKMLFTIDVGNNMSLGMLLCIVFFVFPMILSLVNFLKYSGGDIDFSDFRKSKSKKESDN